jgi:hypothetical protein
VPSRPTADSAQTRAELTALRPDLVAAYDAELPGARAAILARLLGAVGREALPGLVTRGPGEATFADGTVVRFPEAAAAMFARGSPGLAAAVSRRALPSGGRPGSSNGPDDRHAGSPGAADERGTGSYRAVDDPGALVRLLWPGSVLAAEIDNSVANLALARADRAARANLDQRNLGEAEQLVVDGHPLHPCCRTRGGMTVADVLAYAPEHAPVIRLRRLQVPADRWYGTAEPVLYAHPWQADRLRARYPWLTDDGETGPARPLMSLRTVAPIDGGPHVKTAIDVQMTSAVRTVSPAAVHNGPILSALLRELTADLPIDILAETAAGAVIVAGQPQRHLAYLRREAPVLRKDEIALPIAMLSSRGSDPYGNMVVLGDLLFAPLVALLARGVALEAHGQNTLVVLRDGRPVRILYRDLGGVRVSARRLRAAGVEAPALDGDLPSDDPHELRIKLAAAALGTVASELISRENADPAKLWQIVARAIRNTGTSDAGHLLRDPLPVKATTAMRLAADPLDDQWALLDNPMAA